MLLKIYIRAYQTFTHFQNQDYRHSNGVRVACVQVFRLTVVTTEKCYIWFTEGKYAYLVLWQHIKKVLGWNATRASQGPLEFS